MVLLETVFVFLGLKIKEIGVYLGKCLRSLGIVIGVIIAAIMVCIATGSVILGVWKILWPVSADIQFFNKISEFSETAGYFWAFIIPSGLLGFMVLGFLFCAIFFGIFCWDIFWSIRFFVFSNWNKARSIVLKRRFL